MGSVTAEAGRFEATLNRHHSHFFFHLSRIDHHYGIPRTSIEEAPIRTFAEALLAPNAKRRIYLNPSKRRIILVRHPEHAVFDRAILHAGRRARAPSAALGNYS